MELRNLFLTACAIVAVGGVPIQHSSDYATGTEVFIGTPATRYFLGPAFDSTEIRLFTTQRCPFFAPIAHSESLRAGPSGSPFPFTDNATLAGVSVRNVDVTLSRNLSGSDLTFNQWTDGRIGLGPRSAFAKAGIVAVSVANVSLTSSKFETAQNLELLERIPPPVGGESDTELFIARERDMWTVRARVTITGRRIGSAQQVVVIDPSASDIEIPRAALHEIASTIPGTMADELGRLWLPCDSEGRISIEPHVRFEVEGLESLLLSAVFADPEEHAIKTNQRTGRPICRSTILTHMARPDEWRLNPLMIAGARAVFLDVSTGRVVLRKSLTRVSLPLVSGIEVPTMPNFHDFEVRSSGNVTELRLTPVSSNRVDVPRYTLKSTRAERESTGALAFTFTVSKELVPTLSSYRLPGFYRLSSKAELRVNPDKSVSLMLVRVDPNASPRAYKVFLTRNMLQMKIMIESFESPDEASDESESIRALMRAMGMTV